MYPGRGAEDGAHAYPDSVGFAPNRAQAVAGLDM